MADRVLQLRESGLALKSQAVLFRAAQHSNALELELARGATSVRQARGPQASSTRASRFGDVLAGVPLRTPSPPTRAANGPHLRAPQLVAGIGPAQAGRLMGNKSARATILWRALVAFTPAASAAAAWVEFAALFAALRRPDSAWPGELAEVERWYRPQLDRLHEDAGPRACRRCASGAALLRPIRRASAFLTEFLALDPPAATSEESGSVRARRGLPDSLHHPFGQGPGVDGSVGAQRRRRLPAIGHGQRQRRRDRGGAAPRFTWR